MAVDAWFPVGFVLGDGARARVALSGGLEWQILETQGRGRALLATDALLQRWLAAELVEQGAFGRVQFGDRGVWCLTSSAGRIMSPVLQGKSPNSKNEALAFAQSLRATRLLDTESPLQDALYIEKISRLLPTYGNGERMADDVLLGYWLTGGATLSVKSFRRLQQTLSWLSVSHLRDVVEAGGFAVDEVTPNDRRDARPSLADMPAVADPARAGAGTSSGPARTVFELPGRPELAAFFNEHVVDIVRNRARYQALGIDFPSAVVLHGPPGCGKTFAVERLVDFLGWPSFQVDASSIASPYIHETSKKVSEVFDKAMQSAPSVLVIDEMDAFLADRDSGSGHHRVEEVAEFLRRIPEATKKNVLVLAMTNRVDMIDPAILRRGRFDHVVEVDFATEGEIAALLGTLLAALPTSEGVDTAGLARKLEGRPLSDVAFVVREAARLVARAGRERIDNDTLLSALEAAPARARAGGSDRRIGFL